MIFLSDEDIDVKRVCNKWLKGQPEERRKELSGWLDDLFHKVGHGASRCSDTRERER